MKTLSIKDYSVPDSGPNIEDSDRIFVPPYISKGLLMWSFSE